jgi:crotonobetainyl-CoA:carnitine CoA-transferase CaiB-like acyl-CoA transferase
MLAQLGAEVTKVEPPGGDPFRNFGIRYNGHSAAWLNTNHGKASVHLDLKKPDGLEALHSHLQTADVFIQNWRPSVAEGLGLGADTLLATYPQLVYVGITGFGDSGPRASVAVFDTIIQAASGLTHLESAGERPSPMRSYVADKITACFATQSVLAALLARTKSGKGARIDLAMLDVLAYFDFPDLCQDRTFLAPAPQQTLARGRSNILKTSDGFVAVAPVSGRQIGAAVTAVGHPEWIPELKSLGSPTLLTNMLYDRLESETIGVSTLEALAMFRKHDVPATEAMTIDRHFSDSQTLHNEIYSSSESPAGPIRRVRYPARLNGRHLPVVVPAPNLAPSSADT